jgi:hypothetical protein
MDWRDCEIVGYALHMLLRALKTVNGILFSKPVVLEIYIVAVLQKTYYFPTTNTNQLNAMVVSNCCVF